MRSEGLWTLAELGERVREALSTDYEAPLSARVQAVPKLRTIRYYTTLGLIDRPAEMRGRTAYYGSRHLMQLVAIKRLQVEGLSLSAIQERLAGIHQAALSKIAKLSRSRPREAFWASVPAPVSPVAADPASAAPPRSAPAKPTPIQPLSAIPLLEGLTLLLANERPLTPIDLDSLRQAAEPLLGELRRRRLLNPRERKP